MKSLVSKDSFFLLLQYFSFLLLFTMSSGPGCPLRKYLGHLTIKCDVCFWGLVYTLLSG